MLFRRLWIVAWTGTSWPLFALKITIAIALVTVIFAGVLLAIHPPPLEAADVMSCFKRSFVTFATLANDDQGCQVRPQWASDAISYLQILLSILFFGVLVSYFVALILNPRRRYHFKKTANVRADRYGKRVLTFSFLNDSPTTVETIQWRVIARVETSTTIIKNIPLGPARESIPMAEPFIPLRFHVDMQEFGLETERVSGADVVEVMTIADPAKPDSRIEIKTFVVRISGTTADLNLTATQEHRYRIEAGSVVARDFHDVVANYAAARGFWWRRLIRPKDVRRHFDAEAEDGEAVSSAADPTWIFAYGSLVDPDEAASSLELEDWTADDFPTAHLRGYRRTWNVAMDNEVNLPHYKYFVENDGNRPGVFVAFLNIVEDNEAGTPVNGCLMRVSETQKKALMKRERNYELRDVSDRIGPRPVKGKVFAFVGLKEANARYERANLEKPVLVSSDYVEQVEKAFRRRGRTAFTHYRASTETLEDAGIERRELLLRRTD